MITFLRASKHLGITHLIAKFVKTSKKSAVFDHMLLDCSEKSFPKFFGTFKTFKGKQYI